MLEWTLCAAYIVILSVMACVCTEKGPMRRTIWSLFAVMVAGYALQFSVGNSWIYSALMIGVNAIACRIIVKQPAGQWQGLIGWSFILQIGADTGRVAREINAGASDMTFLYWVTTAIAFAQLLLVIGWGIHARNPDIARERDPDPFLPAQARHAGAS